MEQWVVKSWKQYVNEEILQVLYLHKAQKTDCVRELLKECWNTPIFVPAGCTSIVQPLDVQFNAPSRRESSLPLCNICRTILMSIWMNRSLLERHLLLTKLVGKAREELAKTKEMVERSFKKCEISIQSAWKPQFSCPCGSECHAEVTFTPWGFCPGKFQDGRQNTWSTWVGATFQ